MKFGSFIYSLQCHQPSHDCFLALFIRFYSICKTVRIRKRCKCYKTKICITKLLFIKYLKISRLKNFRPFFTDWHFVAYNSSLNFPQVHEMTQKTIFPPNRSLFMQNYFKTKFITLYHFISSNHIWITNRLINKRSSFTLLRPKCSFLPVNSRF